MYCYKCRPDRTWNIMMSLCCRAKERRINGIHLCIHTYLHTWIHAYHHVYSMWISLLLSLWLLSILQEHADSMYVCMAVSLIGGGHGSVQGCSEWTSSGGGDPPGPFRGQGGQGQGTRKQWRQPTAGTTYDLTYHIVSFIPIYVHTYIHDNSRCLAVWRRRCLLSFSHPYIQVRMSSSIHI